MTAWPRTRWVRDECLAAGPGGGGGGTPPPLSVNLAKITPSPLELGAVLPAGTQFNASEVNVDGALTVRTIQDDDGNPAVDILGQANPVPNAGMGFSYTKTAIGDTVTFTYFAQDLSNNDSDQEVYTWLPRVYQGVAAIPGAIDEAFIEALAESELRADKGISRNGVVWTAGEYLWWAFPQAFNPTTALDFLITLGGSGFPGAVILAQAGVSVTPNTPNGVPVLYDVYRSTGAGLGLTVDTQVTP